MPSLSNKALIYFWVLHNAEPGIFSEIQNEYSLTEEQQDLWIDLPISEDDPRAQEIIAWALEAGRKYEELQKQYMKMGLEDEEESKRRQVQFELVKERERFDMLSSVIISKTKGEKDATKTVGETTNPR